MALISGIQIENYPNELAPSIAQISSKRQPNSANINHELSYSPVINECMQLRTSTSLDMPACASEQSDQQHATCYILNSEKLPIDHAIYFAYAYLFDPNTWSCIAIPGIRNYITI